MSSILNIYIMVNITPSLHDNIQLTTHEEKKICTVETLVKDFTNERLLHFLDHLF